MPKNQPISFGDRVRVRSTPETEALGLAGMIGQVFGQTTPSVTGAKVIGETTGDYAVSVFFDQRDEQLWFAPDLLELLDHALGTTMTLKGVPKTWVRKANGEWSEETT